MRILIVEDEKDFKILIQQHFASHIKSGALEFSFAYNGRQAFDILKESLPFDVVVTDIQMPEMDGLSLLEKIQENIPATRTIIMSAYNDFHCIRRAMNHGAFDFIAKPVSLKDLEESLNKCLKKFLPKKELTFGPQI